MNQSLNKRLQILNDEEIAELYAIPQFTDTERMHYFSSPSELANDLKLNHYNNRNISTKLYFILQYGYFKARHQFYNFSYEVVNKDVGFILEHYMPNGKCPDNLPSRKSQREIKLKLLQFLGYNYDITGTKKIF